MKVYIYEGYNARLLQNPKFNDAVQAFKQIAVAVELTPPFLSSSPFLFHTHTYKVVLRADFMVEGPGCTKNGDRARKLEGYRVVGVGVTPSKSARAKQAAANADTGKYI